MEPRRLKDISTLPSTTQTFAPDRFVLIRNDELYTIRLDQVSSVFPTGPIGPGATITIGTVTTGSETDTASVSNVGTFSNAVFNFTIPRGLRGATGAQGPPGPIGATGAQGLVGATGATGAQGPPGPIGATGAQGPPGATGPIGLTGAQGIPGPIGATGAQGPPGPIGLTGAQGVAGPTGLTGLTGPQGPIGLTGAGATITIGTVTTGNPTDLASVSNAGTFTNAVLNFTIPRGVQGLQGLPGPIGLTGAQGPPGATGAQGPQGATGPIGLTGAQGPIGLTGAQGPPGETGAQGPIGLTGAQGPIGLTGAQGPPGAQGPIGLTGAQGPPGATGAQGPPGATGPIGLTGAQGPPGATGPIGLTGAQGPIGLTGAQGIAGISGVSSLLISTIAVVLSENTYGTGATAWVSPFPGRVSFTLVSGINVTITLPPIQQDYFLAWFTNPATGTVPTITWVASPGNTIVWEDGSAPFIPNQLGAVYSFIFRTMRNNLTVWYGSAGYNL